MVDPYSENTFLEKPPVANSNFIHSKNRAGMGSWSRSEPGVFGSLEPGPEPLEKKNRSQSPWKKNRAGATKKFAGSPKIYLWSQLTAPLKKYRRKKMCNK